MLYAYIVNDLGIRYDLELARPRTLKQAVGAIARGRLRPNTRQPFWAIRNISFEIGRGETIGVIGRNGSGKSTLLLALAGVLEPDEGALRAFGRPTLLTLGAGFDEELTGRQNIYLNAAFLALSRREIDWVLPDVIEFSELGEFVDVPLRQYSTGMRARLGFAIAAHMRPDILLFDEVFSVGDPSFQEKSKAKLEELMVQSSAIVIVSHDPGYLSRMCTRVAWLDRGGIVDFGDADDILSRYAEEAPLPQEEPLRALS